MIDWEKGEAEVDQPLGVPESQPERFEIGKTYNLVADQNPDDVAEIDRLSSKLRLSPGAVKANLPLARQYADAPDLEEIKRTSPVLASMGEDAWFLSRAKDDLPALAKKEQAARDLADLTKRRETNAKASKAMKGLQAEMPEWFPAPLKDAWEYLTDTNLAKEFMSGQAVNRSGILWNRRADLMKQGKDVSPEELTYLQKLDDASGYDTESRGWFGGMAGSAAELVGQMEDQYVSLDNPIIKGAKTGLASGIFFGTAGGPASPITATAGAIAGFGAGFRDQSFRQAMVVERGGAFKEMLSMKHGDGSPVTTKEALLGADIVGVVNGGLELAGLESVLKLVPGLGKVVKGGARAILLKNPTARAAFLGVLRKGAANIATGVAGETTTEVLQEVSNIIGEAVLQDKNVTESITNEEGRARLADIAKKVSSGTFLLGGMGAGINAISDVRTAKRDVAEAQALIANLIDSSESKLAARSPEVYGQAVQQFADAHDAGTIYLQADAIMTKLEEQGLTTPEIVAWAEDKGISREDLDTAIATGSAVELKTGDVAAKMSSDPHLALFQKDFTTAPGDSSESMVDGHLETDAGASQRIEDLAGEQAASDKSIRGDEAAELGRRLSAEVVAAGETKEYGDKFAATVIARANLVAQLTGTDATEQMQRLGVRVTRENLAEFMASGQEALGQAAASGRDGSRMLFQKENVAPWPEGFPGVLGHVTDKAVTGDIDHEAAKHGDIDAGMRLVSRLAKPEIFESIKEKYPDAVLVPMVEEEPAGRNTIPNALAHAISAATDMPIDPLVFSVSKESHRGKGMLPRLLSRKEFSGDVTKGRKYILVEDVVAQGGSVSELRHYIGRHGGKVVAVTSLGLSTREGSGTLALDKGTKDRLEAQLGKDDLTNFLYEHNIAGSIDALTESEGRALLKFESVDALRSSVAEGSFHPAVTENIGAGESPPPLGLDSPGDNNPSTTDPRSGGGSHFQDPTSPRGAVTPENLIVLFEKADRSTALHELGHVFLRDLQFIAETHGVQTKEWADAKAWLGVEDGKPITREQHEKFARHFEAYLREGDAPSPALRSVFQAFKKWLTRAYKTVEELSAASGFEINLTPEVRDLFDRLLASQEDIAAARQADAQIAMIDKATLEENASPDEIAAYRAAVGKAEAEAAEKVDAHRLRGREERVREWRKQAEDTVSNDPLRMALDALCRDEAGAFGKGPGISRETLRPYIGDEGMKKVPENPALWRTEGFDVEHAAAQAGYEDARQFIEEIIKAGTKERAIQRLVESLEVAHDADLDTQEAIRTAASRRQMEIESQIMAKVASNGPRYSKSEMRERWAVAEERLKAAEKLGKVGAELEALQQQVKEEKRAAREAFNAAEANPSGVPGFMAVPQAALREWAEKKIANEKLADAIGVHKLLVASRQLRKEAMAAAKKGDWATAFKANEKARINEALIAQHYKAAAAYRKMKTAWKAAIKTEVAVTYRDQINQLMTKFFLTTRRLSVSEGAASPAKFFGQASTPDEIDIVSSYAPADWIIDGPAMPVSEMTWGQVKDLNETLAYLVGRGRAEKKAALLSRNMAVADAVAATISESQSLPVRQAIDDTAFLSGARKWVRNYLAELSRLSRMMKWMDGFKNIRAGGVAGANETMILDPVMKGIGDKFRETERLKALLDPHLRQLKESMKKHKGKLTHIDTPGSLRRHGKPWTFERVLATALNMGTADNLKKLMDGYWMSLPEIEKAVSILSEADWRAIEGIWQAIDTMWPKIKEVHDKINFFPLAKMKGQAFSVTTADGTVIVVQGGYYPLRYDGEILRKMGAWQERDELLNRHDAILQTPSAKAGMAKGRVKGVQMPIKLDLSVLMEHLADTTTYAHLAIPIMDADRITRNDDYMEAAENVMGKELADMIRPALKDILRRDSRRLTAVEEVIQTSKRFVSFYYIGWDIWSAVQNVVNIFPVLKMVGPKVFASGVSETITAPREMHRKMVSLSSYMAERDDSVEREMKRQWNKFRPEFEVKGVTIDDVRNSGFALMKLTDTMFTMPMWWGSYNEGLEIYGGDEAAAVAHADKKVQAVFGSGMTLDQSMFQRDPGWQGLLTTFASWFMTQQQMTANDWQAMKAGKTTKAQFAYDYAMVVLFPSLATTFLFSLLTKGEPPEWEEVFADLGSNVMAGLPAVRDLVPIREMFGKANRQPTGIRIPAAEVAKDIQRAMIHLKRIEDEKLLWDMFKLASYYSGIPAARKYEMWQRGSKQKLPWNVLIPAKD